MKRNFKFNGLVIFFLILGGLALLPYLFDDSKIADVSYSTLVEKVDEGKVSKISEEAPYVIAHLKGADKKLRAKMLSNRLADDPGLMSSLKKSNVAISSSEYEGGGFLFWITSLLPMVMMVLLLLFFSNRVTGRMSGMGGMASGPDVGRQSGKRTTFKEVAGLVEAKQDLMEVVEFLRDPHKFRRLGAKIPKGVLMLGEPGTGKTLLARAVAGEARVPFFNVSGSEFVEMFVGVGAARVRDLFNKAKRHAPCIVFIDEIDAVARQRGSGYGGGNDEREQTLNQLLIEMDGFSETQNVIVIAATNREAVLDKAILRPGRFDRQVVVDIPSLQDRKDILRVHSLDKPLASEVDLDKVARKTAGLVGADLANILNEAAILAARHNRDVIKNVDLEEAVERVIAGPERRSKVMSEREKKIVAYHESGHALVAHMLPNTNPIHKISIVPRGKSALGYTMQLPEEDKFLWSRADFLNEIKVLMGGRAAEEMVFEEITSGASNDIEKATRIARNMVSIYGMSDEIGLQTLFTFNNSLMSREERHYSDETAKKVDWEVQKIIASCYVEAKSIIKENFHKLKLLAEHLLKEEIIFENEVAEIIGAGA